MCTKSDANSSTRFPFRVWTHTHKHKITDATDYSPTHWLLSAWVTTKVTKKVRK